LSAAVLRRHTSEIAIGLIVPKLRTAVAQRLPPVSGLAEQLLKASLAHVNFYDIAAVLVDEQCPGNPACARAASDRFDGLQAADPVYIGVNVMPGK
jgi:hypothetical protein